MNIAQKFAAALDNDGQKFETATGVDFEDLAEQMGAVPTATDEATIYTFGDESQIVCVGVAWDLMEGNGWGLEVAE